MIRSQEVRALVSDRQPGLYGDETLEASRRALAGRSPRRLDRSGKLPVRVVWKPTLTGPDAILNVCLEANSSPACAGVITWMHTFSPAKMWIAGLTRLDKPLAHLHTQFNRDCRGARSTWTS